MSKLFNIKEASNYLNVSKETLRNWDRDGKLKSYKTDGGHRRYHQDNLDKFIGKTINDIFDIEEVNLCCTYARVSSHEQKQKGDLDRQSQRLSEYCAKNNFMVVNIIKDVGSGLNDNRNGFNKLTDLVINKKINKVIIENKDRLTRFQFNFIEKMFKSYGCQIVTTDKKDISSEEELATDMMSLLASFSGKFYGKRSAERRKLNKINNVKSN